MHLQCMHIPFKCVTIRTDPVFDLVYQEREREIDMVMRIENRELRAESRNLIPEPIALPFSSQLT